MATATMATAAGAVMILYFVLSRTVLAARKGDGEGPDGGGDISKSTRHSSERRRLPRRPAQPPATWREAVGILSETLRFTYSETLGKWPIGDLAFGIKYLMRRQGDLQVASIYAGDNCKQLKGPEVIVELSHLLRLLSLCMLFSKKPFPVFLESAGYTEEDVLLQEPKAGLLKPAFTILRDKNSKCLLLLIRGTHSIKDTLTAATGAVVPFHHSVVHKGGVSNLVLGYAHCGMVAAACWIAKCTTPCLLKAVGHNPDYNIKVVGHSLGGGTAALLTYILREYKELSSSTCVAFAPAACMTWDLAESGKPFITTIVNSSDLVPTFSTASIDDLRSEVTASSWLSDLRDQVEHTRFINVVFRSVTALGARLPSICSAKARVAGAGALLHPVSSSTQIVMKRAQNVAQAVVRTRSSLSSWSCMGARRRVVGTLASPKDSTNDSSIVESIELEETDLHCSEYSAQDTEEEEQLIRPNHVISVSVEEEEEMTERELWLELEKELTRHGKGDIEVPEEEAAVVEEITKEENVVLKEAIENKQISSMDAPEVHRFYPPGLIMHMVAIPALDAKTDYNGVSQESIGIYLTPRDLYSKLRLSRTMINDHYMPMYKKMIELLIEKLEKDVECCTVI